MTMNENSPFYSILLVLLLVLPHATFSQHNSVSYGMGLNLKQIPLGITDTPRVAIVQDKVHIAISSSKGLILEIKGLPLKQLECGKLIYGKTFIIRCRINDQMYCSKLEEYRNTIGIVCLEKNILKLYVKGFVYKGVERLKLNAQLNCRIKNNYEY